MFSGLRENLSLDYMSCECYVYLSLLHSATLIKRFGDFTYFVKLANVVGEEIDDLTCGRFPCGRVAET